MASNQTARYGLNQWAADDQVLREEFNRDNAILENTLNRLDFVTGTYSGRGYGSQYTQTIDIGFVPALLMVFPAWGNEKAGATAATPTLPGSDVLIINGSSFTVRGYLNLKASDSYGDYVNPYRYFAWRMP